jgi:hypothetical protein
LFPLVFKAVPAAKPVVSCIYRQHEAMALLIINGEAMEADGSGTDVPE